MHKNKFVQNAFEVNFSYHGHVHCVNPTHSLLGIFPWIFVLWLIVNKCNFSVTGHPINYANSKLLYRQMTTSWVRLEFNLDPVNNILFWKMNKNMQTWCSNIKNNALIRIISLLHPFMCLHLDLVSWVGKSSGIDLYESIMIRDDLCNLSKNSTITSLLWQLFFPVRKNQQGEVEGGSRLEVEEGICSSLSACFALSLWVAPSNAASSRKHQILP